MSSLCRINALLSNLVVRLLCFFLNASLDIFFFLILFIFWLRWVLVAARGLSLVAARVGSTLRCGACGSHCGGFSCCGAQPLGVWVSVVAADRFSSCGTRALECTGFSSCGTWA